MFKEQVDELYHLLRVVSNDAADDDRDQNDAFVWLVKHVLEGGYYLGLVKYCAFYGEKFLLQRTYEAICDTKWEFTRIAEFGAGLGWLSRGLASKFKIADVITVDKRLWGAINLVADLETSSGLGVVGEALRKGDLIVMSDFLHCVENPGSILHAFSEYPMAVLEYMPTNTTFTESFNNQLRRYGGDPINAEEMLKIVKSTGRYTVIIDLDPYVLMLIDKEA